MQIEIYILIGLLLSGSVALAIYTHYMIFNNAKITENEDDKLSF